MKVRKLVQPVMGGLLAGVLALSIASVSAQDDSQPFLGITFADDSSGARVTGVLPGGPADDAGLEIGDIVASVNGEDVTGDTIGSLIAGMEVGDTIALSVNREDQTIDLEATLASRDEALNFPTAPQRGPAQSQPGVFLGIGLENTDDGVTIREVVPGSPAEKAGLQVGDVVTAVNGSAVADGRDLSSAIRALSAGDTVTLDITRDGEAQTVEAMLAEAPAQPARPTNPMSRGGMLNEGLALSVDGTDWTLDSLTEAHPLYAAGLREGDVITQFNGQTYDPQTLMSFLATLDPASMVTVTMTRDGETQELDVPTSAVFQLALPGMGFDFGSLFGQGLPGRQGQIPFGQLPFGMDLPFGGVMSGARLGVSVQNLDEQVAQDNNLTVTEGALIQDVATDSPAADAGLQANDIVTAVDGDTVDQERTLRDRLMAYEPGDTVTLSVLRDGTSQDIQVTLSEASPADRMPFFGNGRSLPMPTQPEPAAPATEEAPSA